MSKGPGGEWCDDCYFYVKDGHDVYTVSFSACARYPQAMVPEQNWCGEYRSSADTQKAEAKRNFDIDRGIDAGEAQRQERIRLLGQWPRRTV